MPPGPRPADSDPDARVRIGRPVPRQEDDSLLRGMGRYTTDINRPGQAFAVMVRSQHAHGTILGVDVDDALACPGVLAVYRGKDVAQAGFGPIKCRMPHKNRDGSPMRAPERPALPSEKVRFVGEAVACVVAETRAAARTAAEAVRVDIDPLPALTTGRAALLPGAPALHAGVPGNVALDFQAGDPDAVEAAFAQAANVMTQTFLNPRIVVNAMEPRSAIGEFDAPSGRWILNTPSQGVTTMRQAIAEDVLGVGIDRLRVLTDRVGGSFGMKSQVYPEQVCVLLAARALGRPVKWIDERSESFLSDHHGRSGEAAVSLALDAQGLFLALRIELLADMGAYLVAPHTTAANIVRNIVGPYRIPHVEVRAKAMLTNKTPVGSYRGAGRPEANYYMSRIIDLAASRTGIDPIELRRRNLIPRIAAPHKTATGMTYDSGDFARVLDAALRLADWDGFPARRRASAARGRLRGRGISMYLEATGAPARESGSIRFDEDGGVTIVTGTLDYGQGHATPFAQVVSERLNIPFDGIRLLQGDSDAMPGGGGSGGSRSLISSGEALVEACRAVIEKGRLAAASALEAATSDIEFTDGWFHIAGADRGIGLMALAASPDHAIGAELMVAGPPSTFPNGCHVAEVEIDPETGVVEVARYDAIDDFGVIVNPLIVAGQVHGGVVQGIGQALGEHAQYDDDGQLLTGSYMDYVMPRFADAPPIRWESMEIAATTNALGVKGCGEAGCAGALPSVMGAIVDALSVYGIEHVDMPASPARIWQAITRAQRPPETVSTLPVT